MTASRGRVVRRATPDDIPAIAALLRAADPHSPKADESVLRWQYPTIGDEDRPGSWVVLDDGRLVAHSGGIAVVAVHGGRIGTAVFGADAATHPQHRRRGHFAAAATARVEEARRLGALVSWSLPRPASIAGLRTAGLQPVARGHLRWVLALAGRAATRSSRAGTGDTTARRIDDPMPAVAALAAPPPAGVVRDEAWWRWRYLERPNGRYAHAVAETGREPTGVATATVLRRRGVPVAALCDWHARDPAALRALVDVFAATLPVMAVAAVSLPGSAGDDQLRAVGARRLPRALEPQPLTVLADDDLGPWALSWGELDAV